MSNRWELDDRQCRSCGLRRVECRVIESSDGAYTDYHFHCMACGVDWCVDGPDA